jgi:transposase-like protein
MAGKSPRKFPKNFKFNVVLESFVTGNAAATAARHGIHVTQLNDWRKLLKSLGPNIYEPQKARKNNQQKQVNQLETIIGRLTIENHILKKRKKCWPKAQGEILNRPQASGRQPCLRRQAHLNS